MPARHVRHRPASERRRAAHRPPSSVQRCHHDAASVRTAPKGLRHGAATAGRGVAPRAHRMCGHGTRAHSPCGGLSPLVPGPDRQGEAGRQRPGARHHGDPTGRLRHLGAHAGRDGRPDQGGGRGERVLPAVHPGELPASARPSTSRASRRSWRWSPTAAASSSPSRSWCARPARRSSASSWPSGSTRTGTCRCCSTSGRTWCAGSCARGIFLRTSEFLWQEGHTAHATEADARALRAQDPARGVRGLHGQRARPCRWWSGRKTDARAVRRRDQHVHARRHDGRRQGAADGHQPRAGPELRQGVRHHLLRRPRAAGSTPGPPPGAPPPGCSAA